MADDQDDAAGGAPACFGHELVGGQPVDPVTARDVSRFRKAERARLIEARLAVPAAERTALGSEIAAVLKQLIAPAPGMIISLYWPFRGELDLRGFMAEAHDAGAGVALPVVVAKGQPLVFREWRPGCRMGRGVWNIPVPEDGPEVVPDIVIAPLIGVDAACFRLGYGGGFYDRTLAALRRPARVIGVGHPVAEIPTIFPQPWDVPMDLAVLGKGKVRRREGSQP